MKNNLVKILVILGVLFLLLIALYGIDLLENQKKYYTKNLLEIRNLPILKQKKEGVEMQALQILKDELHEFSPLYVRKVKYTAGDSGLLFYGFNSITNSDTLLFKVVNNKNRSANRRLRQLGSSEGIKESYDLSILIDSEYYTIMMVEFSKDHKTNGFLIEASLPMPGFSLKIDP